MCHPVCIYDDDGDDDARPGATFKVFDFLSYYILMFVCDITNDF